ncbi:ion transporter [Magnetococcales bacterium HHB-1]
MSQIDRLRAFIEDSRFKNFIIIVIMINAAVLGLQITKGFPDIAYVILDWLDTLCLIIFILEIVFKFIVYRLGFFRSGWNVFDFLVVGIALIPTQDGLSILRAFRVLRVFRLITSFHSMRRVVAGMLLAIPGVGSVGGLLLLVFYICSVMATSIFGGDFPDWFGSISKSMYTLFQVMTLESWSMGIVRPVMELYPYSWIFFLPFIVLTTFTVLNLFIGIIVDAMAAVKEQENQERYGSAREKTVDNIEHIKDELSRLERKLDLFLASQQKKE